MFLFSCSAETFAVQGNNFVDGIDEGFCAMLDSRNVPFNGLEIESDCSEIDFECSCCTLCCNDGEDCESTNSGMF